MSRVRLVITSPLPDELVAAIRATDGRLDVVHEPDLLTPARYASDHPLPLLEEAGARERWEALLAEAEVLFDFGPLELATTLAARPHLRWIQATSAGIGMLAKRVGLTESSIAVTTAGGVHARPLAEFAVLAMLIFGKDALRLGREQREHRWERYAGEEVAGKTVCVVGLGKVGREVARLARALDARVVGTVREIGDRVPEELCVERLEEIERVDELLPEADVLVLAVPHTALTHRLLDARRLALLKPGAIVVNIARGDVVDEGALIDALRSGHLRGAALDVFEQEPLPRESPLWELPNVLVSPHSASTVAAENERIVQLFQENIRRYLDGRLLLNLLDKELLY
ncbi:MAG: D-2-hydroxyacid dehydrogenase [Gaiellaceae bacterium]